MSVVVEAAKVVMGLDVDNRVFSTDILRVELSGPRQPHLTLVDLPGLFQAGNKDQSEADAKLVESLVVSYMKNPRSIIVAVVSAKNDFANQQVTRQTRAVDPKGNRTLGLITKPDSLDEGSDSERFFVQLAQNRDVKFRLGWHVLRNRDYQMRGASNEERDLVEKEFFRHGAWNSLHPSHLGIANLRQKLSNILRDQILQQLPTVIREVDAGIKDCKNRLDRLGRPRGSTAEQRAHLLQISSTYSNLMTAAIDGVYTDPFFSISDSAGVSEKLLRAFVQKTLSKFSEDMRLRGHAMVLSGKKDQKDRENEADKSTCRHVSRSDYIKEVKEIMEQTRGRELPGTYNPLVVAKLFSTQCQPWEELAGDLGELMYTSCCKTVSAILEYIADEETAEGLRHEVVLPSLETIKKNLQDKMAEILGQHISSHPITYNEYLTENVQKAQVDRLCKAMEKLVGKYDGENGKELINLNKEGQPYGIRLKPLLDMLVVHMKTDMNDYAASMAIDLMVAYYKVAIKRFVDDVCVLAIENCLIKKLPEILSVSVVCALSDAEVERISAESSEAAAERADANEKLKVLQTSKAQLKRFKAVSAASEGSEDVTDMLTGCSG